MNTVSLNKPHQKIGKILKVYREKLNQKQGQIARKAGISTSMLSQIERSVVSPSIETLCNVCDALGLDVTQLFSSILEKSAVRIHHADERLKTERKGVVYEQLAVSPDMTHPAEMFSLEIAPGQIVGFPENGHEGVEMGFVLCGEAVLKVNDQEYCLKNGDSVTFNATLIHGLENRGVIPFRAIWNVLPPHKDLLGIE